MSNPLVEVQKYGQSIWFDNIRRGLILSGELMEMVEHDGLCGVTSNPAIFEKAIAGSADYDQALRALVAQEVGDSAAIYEALALEDIRLAADVLYPVYARTGGRDGFVSFEVSPYLAHDTEGTIQEARRLHAALGRENVMIKVPATPEGLPAIRTLIGEGININVTLLFAVEMYEAVAKAYREGLEALASKDKDLGKVASVASFFVSRIDTLVDEKLAKALGATQDPDRRTKLKSLAGKVAIANAVLAYDRYHAFCASLEWKALADTGARPQRLLWASTSTKNPKYPKTLYVDELIGPETVNTVPAETYHDFKAGGRVRPSLSENWTENLEHSRALMRTLEDTGISMKELTGSLLADGVKKFSEAFDKLLSAVEKKRQSLLAGELARQTFEVGAASMLLEAALDDWRLNGKVRRLWRGDTSLWTNADENEWLGWLHVVDREREHLDRFEDLAQEVQAGGFRHAMVLGMGGSSLCPDVLRRTFGVIKNFPELYVLDSTVPAQVRAFERKVDIAKTLFIVSSKSGTTIEPNAFKQYFMDRVRKTVGEARAGDHFIAITDPGKRLEDVARDDGFRHVYHGVTEIGGRFSALSHFGMVPGAVMGLDVGEFLDRAEVMVQSCASCVPPELNPGVVLGVILGTMHNQGRDKVTLIASPGISSLGAWLEQLLAESTGKKGKGLVPIDKEPLGPPEVYGSDRLFVYERLSTRASAEQDAAVRELERAGHPVVRIALQDPMDLGQEFFRWEMATAVAGSVIGINPFDQPDVEASKVATRRLTSAYEETRKVPDETPLASGSGVALFADPKNAQALVSSGSSGRPEALLAAHLARLRPGDYFAINAYVEMNESNRELLQAVRLAVRNAKRVATTLGFGPRFLHSTGQLHKGGPGSGVFLQITSDDADDLEIPGQKYSFGLLKRFQAQGDFEVLAERGRRLLRVHLGPDVLAGLATLREMVKAALG
jgi:transaldolase/glucose-6-phosphate isomerase